MSTEIDIPGVNPQVVFVNQQSPMAEVVELMVDRKISSVLVHDDDEVLVGIITERDIVRKFTLIQLSDKLTRAVNTVMSRPVHCVTSDNYQEEIITLYVQKGLRHFPVVSKLTSQVKCEDVLGIVSVSDFLKQFIFNKKKADKKQTKIQAKLSVLAENRNVITPYVKALENLDARVEVTSDFHSFFKSIAKDPPPLLFDLDAFPSPKLKSLIPSVLRYTAPLIISTGQLQLAAAFYPRLTAANDQHLLLKPLDVGYCYWLLEKWAGSIDI